MNIRKVIPIALAVIGFVAVVKLRDQFGTGQMSPQMQREVAEAAGHKRGDAVGRDHLSKGITSPNVPELAKRTFEGITTGPKRDWWEAEFVRGYTEAFSTAPKR